MESSASTSAIAGSISLQQPEYYNLGSYRRNVSTKSPDCQLWFDRGLIWSFAFNHEEAAVCFGKAIDIDPKCAMAYWGLAYCLGPNYNKPWEIFNKADLAATVKQAYQASREAKAHAENATTTEQALIDALMHRYPYETPMEKTSDWNLAYAHAMETVYKQVPDDLDVATLYAESLMNLSPWKLWNLRTGEPLPGSHALKVKAIFDHALTLAGALSHPGLLHFYIHYIEQSATPEKGIVIADHLRGLCPDAGHLEHMPTHLDLLIGDYRRCIASNSDAIRADDKYVARNGIFSFYNLYRAHSYHFRLYAALFAGQYRVSMQTADEYEKVIPEEFLRMGNPSMGHLVEGLFPIRVHALIRFGKWQELLDLPLPKDQVLYCSTVATIQYGKGMALSALGRVKEAEEMYTLFAEAVARLPPGYKCFIIKALDIFAIADSMFRGELEYRKGNYDAAFEHLRKGIEQYDDLPYSEPWGWMHPVRHAYGALLLEQGKVEEAAEVYKADLGMDNTLPRAYQHPGNVWALHGLHECLNRLGHTQEARAIEPQLRLALAVADVPITSSCFCRLETADEANSAACCSSQLMAVL